MLEFFFYTFYYFSPHFNTFWNIPQHPHHFLGHAKAFRHFPLHYNAFLRSRSKTSQHIRTKPSATISSFPQHYFLSKTFRHIPLVCVAFHDYPPYSTIIHHIQNYFKTFQHTLLLTATFQNIPLLSATCSYYPTFQYYSLLYITFHYIPILCDVASVVFFQKLSCAFVRVST